MITQETEFDHWFNSDETLPVDGEHIWARRANGPIRPCIFSNHPSNVCDYDRSSTCRNKFVVEGDAGALDMWGQVYWQPRTTITI